MISADRAADERILAVDREFSLAETCGPVVWGRGRWPNVDWIGGALVWVGREDGEVVHRIARQPAPGTLVITGERDTARDRDWAERVLGIDRRPPVLEDPVVAAIAVRFAGLRPYSSGSLFTGIVSCIAGQSISVAAAAITEARLFALFHPGIELGGRIFWPAPLPEHLASADAARIRESGVTWRRAEAIVAAANAWQEGMLPTGDFALRDPAAARAALRRLPLVGEWTAESALLWGIGLGDAFPPNDAALLRAAKAAYRDDALDHRRLIELAERWRPARGWAARWLWTALFGVAQVQDG